MLSYRTFTEFEPIIVEVRDADGRIGWGEGTHLAGFEQRDARGRLDILPRARRGGRRQGHDGGEGHHRRQHGRQQSRGDGAADGDRDAGGSSAAPGRSRGASAAADAVQQLRPEGNRREVERRLEDGFRTFKIKVGKDADDDARRVKAIQQAIAGRATMRLDANRAYSEAEACRFAAALDPSGIELFEQPCPAEDWEANANVAGVSPVPVMLDEPICTLDDVERAGGIGNVGFCKLKLKRFGGLDLLHEALDAVRAHGMEPVLGDGLGMELGCWMEGLRRARHHPQCRRVQRIFEAEGPAVCRTAAVRRRTCASPGFRPPIDRDVLAAHETARERFAPAMALPIGN